MPGKRVCNSTIASPMVAALISTSSSLLVNLRSGVGIRTFFDINLRIHFFLLRQQRLELAQARLDFARFAAMTLHGVERLQSVAGHADDGGRILRNLAARNEFLRHVPGGP